MDCQFKSLFSAMALAVALFFSLSPVEAQQKNDVIQKRDSTRIQALITQMTYEKINYRDLSTPDSAKKYISMDNVARIFLKSGRIINVRDSIPDIKLPPDSVGQYADLNNLPANAFDKGVVMANSDQLRDRYEYHHNKSIDGKTGAIVFTSIGAASLVSGLIIAGSGSDKDNKKIGTSLAIAGPVVGGVLGLIGYRNYRFHRNRAEKVKNELERRNQPLVQPLGTLELIPQMDFGNRYAGMGVRIGF